MKNPLTLADLFALRTVSDPQLSPDGHWVAYVVTVSDLKTNLYNADIHLVPALGGEPYKLTNGPKRDDTPRWSPDGRWIAFISGRGEGDQLHLIRPFGGEAEGVTQAKGGVTAFAWAPDSGSIAYLSPDPPSPAEEERKKAEGDYQLVDRHHHMQHLHLLDLQTRKSRRLTRGPFHVSGCCWAPDGRQLAFSHQPTPGANDWIKGGISVVARGGRPRALVGGRAGFSSLCWSPDGRWIAGLRCEGWLEDVELQLVAPAQRTVRQLKPKTGDLAFGASLAWAPDSRALYLPLGQGTAMQLCRMRLSGRFEHLTQGPEVCGPLSVAGGQLAFLRQDGATPPELFVSPLSAFAPRQLTNHNSQLRKKWLARKDLVRWKSPDGTPVEGLLIKPAGYRSGKPVPLLVCVHGGPAGVFTNTFNGVIGDRYPHQVFAGLGYAVLLPNPRGSAQYGSAFRRANVRDWGGGDLQDILSGVDYLVGRGIADPERLGILGWSYGGFMTGWAITQTNRFKAASSGAGLFNLASMYGQTDIPGFMERYWEATPWADIETYSAHSAITHAARIRTPTLIQHGDRDVRVPLPQAQELYQALKRRRVPVEFIVYPRQGHALSEPKLVRAVMQHNLEWFERWLKGGKAGGKR